MSIYGMKPQFTTYEGYKEWRKQWAKVYNDLTDRIKRQKLQVMRMYSQYMKVENEWEAKRMFDPSVRYSNPYYSHYEKAVTTRRRMGVAAFKLNTVLEEGKKRMVNITAMKKAMQEHQASFPIKIDDCDKVEFHFNKKNLEYPWIPMWVVKTKGNTYYVNHVNANCPWTTRETPDNESTKGSIRFRRCELHIDAEGIATLTSTQ
jgi:hypothetical protein